MSWSDVVPNFDTLPPAMQVWIKDNMQSLVAAAMQSAEQMSASQSDAAHNYGVSAAGTSYQLTGQNHFLAVQGGSQEVVGQEKQQLLSGGLTTLNTKHEYKQVDGIATKSIGGNSYLQVLGDAFQKLLSSHNSVEKDEVTIIGGTSTKIVSQWESIQIGSGTAGGNEIVSHEEVYGSENKLVWGNGWERITGNRYAAVGKNVQLPVPESSLQEGKTQAPVKPPEHSTQNKNIQDGFKLGWTAVSGSNPSVLATDITTTILGATPPTADPVSKELIGGDKEESVYGSETVLITGNSKETVLGGTNHFISGNMSELKMGMSSDTLLGLSMDTVIGMSMPFETITMGQVLLSLDATVFDGESSSFHLSMSSMKILTTGAAAAAADVKAASEAADVTKDARAFEDAAKASEDAQDSVDALEKATEASQKAAKVSKELKDAAKAAEDAMNASKEVSEAAKASKTATEAEKAAAATKATLDATKAAKAAEASAAGEKAAKSADTAVQSAKAADDAAKATAELFHSAETEEELAALSESVKNAGELAETAGKDATTASKDATETAEAVTEAQKAAEASAKASEEVVAAQREAAEANQFAKELEKTISIPDSFLGAKGFDWLTKGPVAALFDEGLTKLRLSKNVIAGIKAASKVAFKTASVGVAAQADFSVKEPPGEANDGSKDADKAAANAQITKHETEEKTAHDENTKTLDDLKKASGSKDSKDEGKS